MLLTVLLVLLGFIVLFLLFFQFHVLLVSFQMIMDVLHVKFALSDINALIQLSHLNHAQQEPSVLLEALPVRLVSSERFKIIFLILHYY